MKTERSQLRRLYELEDVLAEQDNSIAALQDKLTRARQETNDWKFKHDEVVRLRGEDKEK